MSRKSKGVVLDSTSGYGVGVYEDAKARLRHQTLMQDYEELQRESDAMRSHLEAANQRKLILAAEVRFLRRRHKYLVKANNMNLSQKQNCAKATNLLKQVKTPKEQFFVRNETSQQILPIVPERKKKKKQYPFEQVALSNAYPAATGQANNKTSFNEKQASKRTSTPVSNMNLKEEKRIRKETLTPMLDKKDSALRNSMPAFDLNKVSLPPTFDLNEISTGDENFQMNVEAVKFEEAKKSLIKGINDEQQNDLKLAVCRNSGEGSSRVGKRKISWQDPVALRV
ncbi:hypothetical protein CASFOL_013822 [Castilleja foliolosa]|uniref:Uncharacterized protein n=1 Tax=Castilleja foliolosa TaxID=1961234 RepID=A0ABD3DNZ9_9LAMI